MDLITSISPGGLPTLSLTTIAPGYLGGGVAMPLISPLMPVPHVSHNFYCIISVVQENTITYVVNERGGAFHALHCNWPWQYTVV